MKAKGRSVAIGRLRVLNNNGRECECACFKLELGDGFEPNLILVKAFGKLADTCMQSLRKWDGCCVFGAIVERRDGRRVIIAKKIAFINSNGKEREATC